MAQQTVNWHIFKIDTLGTLGHSYGLILDQIYNGRCPLSHRICSQIVNFLFGSPQHPIKCITSPKNWPMI